MIITIKTDDGSVMIDEVCRLEHCPAEPGSRTGACVDYRPRQQSLIPPAGNGIEIALFRDDVFLTRILSYQPIFVMNNRGETVERI